MGIQILNTDTIICQVFQHMNFMQIRNYSSPKCNSRDEHIKYMKLSFTQMGREKVNK